MSDALFSEESPKFIRAHGLQVIGDDDSCSTEQRQEQLANGNIKADRDACEDAVSHAERIVTGPARKRQIDWRGMWNFDAFGESSGARGVNDVGQTARIVE